MKTQPYSASRRRKLSLNARSRGRGLAGVEDLLQGRLQLGHDLLERLLAAHDRVDPRGPGVDHVLAPGQPERVLVLARPLDRVRAELVDEDLAVLLAGRTR